LKGAFKRKNKVKEIKFRSFYIYIYIYIYIKEKGKKTNGDLALFIAVWNAQPSTMTSIKKSPQIQILKG
jgi:hypothetical protein